jgi:TolB-like protein/DNA-binding winged helix-turn-helix (wHTH) protein
MGETNNGSLKVGDLLVEPATARISGSGGNVNVRPQVMELLVFLASKEGQVASIEELLDTVWTGKVVTEGTLYNCIGELRRTISGLDDSRPYIENIPKRGYRLTVSVERLHEHPTNTQADGGTVAGIDLENSPGRRRTLARAPASGRFPGTEVTPADDIASSPPARSSVMAAVVVGLLFAAAALFYLAWPRDIGSIAVLPFEDLSPGGDQVHLASGFADELRLELHQLKGLRIAARTSSIAYAQEDSKTIGEILKADAIVEGSLRKQGDTIRITVQLTHAADGFTIWSDSYDRKLQNIFNLQEEIAAAVAGALGVRLGVGTVNAFRGAGTHNVEAYELYLKTQTYDWSSLATGKKIRLLERAVELDPNYAAAWSFLGGLTLSTAWDVVPHRVADIVERAYPMVRRGVQLNPESATAHAMLAVGRHARFDWIGAEQSHRRAMALLMDRLIVEGYAGTLMRSGRTTRAQEHYDIAQSMEQLGGRPPGQSWHTKVAQGRFAEAKVISDWQGPADRIENNLDIAFNQADPEELKAAIRAMPETNVAFTALYRPVLAAFDSPEQVLSLLRRVYRDESLQWIRKFHDLAMWAAYFGDPQFALQAKGEEVRANVLRMSSLWYPVMSDVRRLPEFRQLVTELNLVEYWRAYGWADACRPLGDDDFECL